MISLPQLEAINLEGKPLAVVATTSIIGDIVHQVGGDVILLTTLIAAGQDPHSYEPTARDLSTVAKAQVIFVNGWDLEESLIRNIHSVTDSKTVVAVSANIEPLELGYGEQADSGHGQIDPHTWFSLSNVKQWVSNIQIVLTQLDPAHSASYKNNAQTYLNQLAELDKYAQEQLALIPASNRILVTNHDVFAYFARDYEFEVLGAVIPALSTLAEPSAQDLANLIKTMTSHSLCTLFTETISSDKLAKTVAAELKSCSEVKVIPLYTDALGSASSGADTFVAMFKSNIDSMVTGLQP